MNPNRFLYTSESVTEGHPDKMADRISDSILDAILEQDPYGRVACETLVTTGMCLVAGEITTDCYVDIPKVVREAIKEIGYDDAKKGFDYKTCAVITSIDEQSADISQGVDDSEEHEQGAGDQGIMFGYATNETAEYLSMPIVLAHKLTQKLTETRKNGTIDWMGPDGKSQVTVEYTDEKPNRVDVVVIAAQHKEGTTREQIREDIINKVIKETIPAEFIDENTKFFINETGAFILGGPHADCGLTGRKIIVDTYGGVGSHGGGAFSGKDPSKVDRSGCYFARYVAKNVVAAGLADRCEVQVAYAIGVPEPCSVNVNTFGTNKIPVEKIEEIIMKNFNFRPRYILEKLDLRKPIYKNTSAYGHFGRNVEGFTWERTDMAETLRKEAGL